jgi:hypothetical protein
MEAIRIEPELGFCAVTPFEAGPSLTITRHRNPSRSKEIL